MCVLRAACSVVRKQFFVNKLAKNVSGQDMGFLNSRSLVAGDTNAVIHDIPQLPSGLPRKPDRKQFLLPRLTDGLKHVGGVSTRADGKSHVTSISHSLDLACKHVVKGIVVADGGQGGSIGGQGPARQASSFFEEPSAQLRRQMLGVCRAAAISKEENLFAGAETRRHRFGCLNHCAKVL